MSVNQLIAGHQACFNNIFIIRFFSLCIAQFSGTHNTYTNSICWLKGSYYLPTEESML
jgi:hypothetical protein